MRIALILGRILFSSLFIGASFGHFSKHAIEYGAHYHVPIPAVLVPLSGIIALLGGISVLIGYRARLGACLLIIFLIPVTFFMHKFWGIEDPMAATIQQVMFTKNLALIGASLMIIYFGAGPWSLDYRRKM